MRRARLLAGALALLAAASGCGYSTGLRLPPEYRTVGVEVFGNDSNERDVEVELQQQLTDAVDRLLHAPIVDPAVADLILRGRVVRYEHRNGIRSSQNILLETGVTITLEVQLVQRFDEATVFPGPEPSHSDEPPNRQDDRNSMPRTAPNERVLRPLRATQDFGYLYNQPYTEAVARERTLANLSERIVLDLFGTLPGREP